LRWFLDKKILRWFLDKKILRWFLDLKKRNFEVVPGFKNN